MNWQTTEGGMLHPDSDRSVLGYFPGDPAGPLWFCWYADGAWFSTDGSELTPEQAPTQWCELWILLPKGASPETQQAKNPVKTG